MTYSVSRFWKMMCSILSAITFTLLFFSPPLRAADAARPVTEAVSPAQIINLMAGLVLVLLVFFAIVYLLKRFSGLHGLNKGHMKIVDAMHLGAKERLLIVKVSGEYLLLGLSAQGIYPLHVLNNDFIENDEHEEKEAPVLFNQLLARMKSGRS